MRVGGIAASKRHSRRGLKHLVTRSLTHSRTQPAITPRPSDSVSSSNCCRGEEEREGGTTPTMHRPLTSLAALPLARCRRLQPTEERRCAAALPLPPKSRRPLPSPLPSPPLLLGLLPAFLPVSLPVAHLQGVPVIAERACSRERPPRSAWQPQCQLVRDPEEKHGHSDEP